MDREREPSFRVSDRRWWANPDQADEPAEAEQRKPTYVEKLESELRAKDEQLQETLTRYRSAADEFERARGRIERDAARQAQVARVEFLRSFVELIDDIDRAVAAAGDASGPLAEGVALLQRRFLTKLREHGVERIEPLGEPFDPQRHEAMSLVPGPAESDGRVVGVIAPGYLAGDQILRPAQVAVGKAADAA